jgi:pullulanase
MQPLLANPALKPSPKEIAATSQAFQDFLRIRYGTGLFRMATFAEVQANLSFLNTGSNQIPGLIGMRLDDHGHDYGGGIHHVIVFFNATNAAVSFTDASLKGMNLTLDPLQSASSDATLLQAKFDSKKGAATIPALTTVVFVDYRE